MEVIKIRLQAQHHSMADPLDIPKYRNAAHALYTVLKEEGVGALYRGVSLTALRQGSNQAGEWVLTVTFRVGGMGNDSGSWDDMRTRICSRTELQRGIKGLEMKKKKETKPK